MRSLGLLPVFACMLSGQELTAVKLTPGVTATLKRNPAGLRESFAVTGSAGQTLLVELNIGGPSAYINGDLIQVSGPGNRIVEPGPAGAPELAWMGVLPQPGTYLVTVLRGVKKPYVLRVTLMDPHDPRIDVGLRASQISLPALAKQIEWSHEIFRPVIPDLAEFGPDRWEALVGQMSVHVMTVEGFKKTWWFEDEGARRVARLEAALKSGVVTGSPGELPGQATEHINLVFFAARKVIRGPGLQAVRWVDFYDWTASDSVPVDPIGFAADGITPDGRYFVMIRGLVSHPAVPNAAFAASVPAGDRVMDFGKKLALKLDSAPPESFTPSLETLDDMVRSFAIR
jgi:hypothetical protein